MRGNHKIGGSGSTKVIPLSSIIELGRFKSRRL